MADLIAQGTDTQQRWRRSLPVGRPIILGRTEGAWNVAWDDRVSRRHAELVWDGQELEVRQVAEARNPIFVKGEPAERFRIEPGEHFVVGQTIFTLTDEEAHVSLAAPAPLQQQAFTAQYLHRHQFRHPDTRIDVLSHLPDVISGSASDTELFVRLVNMLLTGIPRASAAAIVACCEDATSPQVDVLHWDRRRLEDEDFQPSQRLILDAIGRGESVLHVWGEQQPTGSAAFTVRKGVDWAFCTPVGGKACQGWALYVTGSYVGDATSPTSDPTDLRDDLKFTELAASTLASLRDVRMLEQQRASLSQFFSPVVLEALAGQDPDVVLKPREADVSVLFCDLRGFARHSERAADDLLGLLHRVSNALGVTTRHIRENGGVLGDFHGDAAMGFWGWPLEQADRAVRACVAALAIRREFAAAAARAGDVMADFQLGIGIASGRAVAGKIGTVDQVKVTVFGPVVNLASRLEGMTKTLHAPILVDEATAAALRGQLAPSEGRLRRVAVVRPYGLETSLEVTELLPPAADDPLLSDEAIEVYERALDELVAGRWSAAFELLHHVPAEDRVKDFLTVLIAQHNRTPPAGWKGVIELAGK